MFNLGLFELTLFAIIALIVLGPDKLLLAARTLGKWYARFLHTKERLQRDIVNELNLLETQQQIQAELAKIRKAEADMQAQMQKLQGQINKNSQEIMHLTDPLASDTAPNTATDITLGTLKGNPETLHTPITTENTIENTATVPMNGRFFLLGDYDRHRRLPSAPFLPNRQADSLLYLNHDQGLKP